VNERTGEITQDPAVIEQWEEQGDNVHYIPPLSNNLRSSKPPYTYNVKRGRDYNTVKEALGEHERGDTRQARRAHDRKVAKVLGKRGMRDRR
jgi:hypothetical protein